jgi:predicted RNA binding protein YcfA (HicA-like mRNA interferase family)
LKRKHLIKELIQNGCVLLRHGAKHDIYHNPKNGNSQPVPRHSDINEILAKKIFSDLTKSI